MRQIGAYPRSPLTALAEHIQAIRTLLAGETVSITGDYVQLDGVRLDHPPANAPPVLAGVRGPRSLDRWIDQLVIAGDLTHCADRIASLAGQGIDHVILGFPAGIAPGQQDTVSRQLLAAVAGSLP